MTAPAAPLMKLLCVDDEEAVLQALRRLFRKQYAVTVVQSAAEALAAMAEQQFDIIISDMRMPQMDGADFLAAAARQQPDAVRILLTGFADHEATVRAINDGRIFRYLHKPWDNEGLLRVVEEAAKQRQRLVAINSMQDVASVPPASDPPTAQTQAADVENWVQLISNIISTRIGIQSDQVQEVANRAAQAGEQLGLGANECRDLRWAVMLHGVGRIGLAQPAAPSGVPSHEALHQYRTYPLLTEAALWAMPVLQPAATIIHHMFEEWNGSGYPDQLVSEEIPLSSRILRPLVEFLDHVGRDEMALDEAITHMVAGSGRHFDPDVVDLLERILVEDSHTLKVRDDLALTTMELKVGMRTSRPVTNSSKLMILNQGMRITHEFINRLMAYETGRQEYLTIYVEKPDF